MNSALGKLALILVLVIPTSALAWDKVDSSDGITVFKKDIAGSSLIAVRGVTTIESNIAKVYSVFMDQSRMTEWVDRLEEHRVLKRSSPHDCSIYQHYKLPMLFSDRDYVTRMKATRMKDGTVTISVNSCQFSGAPETVGVRATLTRSLVTLKPLRKNRTHVSIEIQTDPKGMLPDWVVNMLQKSWPRQTLLDAKKQASKSRRPMPLPQIRK